MKVKRSKNGKITLTATKNKPHELTEWFKNVAKSAEQKESTQICYKTNEPCKHDCKGLCRESC